MQGLSSDFKQFFLVKNTLLTSVHNDTDNADDADDANDYNRVIGIAQLKAFTYAKNITYRFILFVYNTCFIEIKDTLYIINE